MGELILVKASAQCFAGPPHQSLITKRESEKGAKLNQKKKEESMVIKAKIIDSSEIRVSHLRRTRPVALAERGKGELILVEASAQCFCTPQAAGPQLIAQPDDLCYWCLDFYIDISNPS